MEILAKWITDFISQVSYGGIFALMLLESACIPIPSEVTMPFSGFLASTGRFDFWLVVLTGAFGNLIGSWIAYFFGWWGQDPIVRASVRRWGRFLLVSERELDHAEVWFRKYGEPIVFFSRILPVVRTFISVPAGIAKMNFLRFSLYTFLGSLIWSYILTKFGFSLGENWNLLESYFRKFEIFIGIFLVVILFWYTMRKVRKL